jgi:hypothetical protein
MNASYFPSPKKDVSNIIEESYEKIEPVDAVLNKVANKISHKKSMNIFDKIIRSSRKSPKRQRRKSPKRRRRSSKKRSNLKSRKSKK